MIVTFVHAWLPAGVAVTAATPWRMIVPFGVVLVMAVQRGAGNVAVVRKKPSASVNLDWRVVEVGSDTTVKQALVEPPMALKWKRAAVSAIGVEPFRALFGCAGPARTTRKQGKSKGVVLVPVGGVGGHSSFSSISITDMDATPKKSDTPSTAAGPLGEVAGVTAAGS